MTADAAAAAAAAAAATAAGPSGSRHRSRPAAVEPESTASSGSEQAALAAKYGSMAVWAATSPLVGPDRRRQSTRQVPGSRQGCMTGLQLARQFRALMKNPIPGISAAPSDDDLFVWNVQVDKPFDTSLCCWCHTSGVALLQSHVVSYVVLGCAWHAACVPTCRLAAVQSVLHNAQQRRSPMLQRFFRWKVQRGS
jgi:hypothetical protein